MGINFRTGEYAHPARLRREARQMRAAYAFYEPKTVHDSSLSYAPHASWRRAWA